MDILYRNNTDRFPFYSKTENDHTLHLLFIGFPMNALVSAVPHIMAPVSRTVNLALAATAI
jgi:hypothetical protein